MWEGNETNLEAGVELNGFFFFIASIDTVNVSPSPPNPVILSEVRGSAATENESKDPENASSTDAAPGSSTKTFAV